MALWTHIHDCFITKKYNYLKGLEGLVDGSVSLGVGFQVSRRIFVLPMDQKVALKYCSSAHPCVIMLPTMMIIK